jgi:hypothetical protein
MDMIWARLDEPHLVARSDNRKTGPIPVSTTSADTCPDACPLKDGGGCYGEANFHMRTYWNRVTLATTEDTWPAFFAKIRKLRPGQLWRHNQAGDLPGDGDAIDTGLLAQLVDANRGKRGFTYTHKPPVGQNARAIKCANENGFTVNLSANNLGHADTLAALDIGPVVVIIPSSVHGNVKMATPEGRKVVVCPATYRDDVTCQSCGLCQIRDRKVIVGFPAHGTATRKADAIARAA